ncbi:MAG TPA: type II secretion system F family protein [Longimicrobiales bacterium]|nr:type II secretion system F family protein [Longimicrobiales bacterium]
MPMFAYRAVDTSGKRHTGVEEATTPAEASHVLEQRGLLVLEIATRAAPSRRAAGARRSLLDTTRGLASLLSAGLPLSRALEVTRVVVGRGMGEVLEVVSRRVRRGESLHAALAEHARIFPPAYVGVVRAGERSGDVAAALHRLEAQLEREGALRARLLSAALYPSILALVGGVAIVLLTLFVLPRFAELLLDAGASLPASTRLLLVVSDASVSIWPVLVVGPPVAVAAAAAWVRTERGRRAASRVLLTIPGVRALRRDALAGRFARLAGTLAGGGAPLLDALGDTAESLSDPLARDEVVRVRKRVREGVTLNRALEEGDVFPPLLSRLVAVGEESGRLEEFLGKAADLFETRVARSSERLASLAEPAMILAFGAVVGLVALSLLQAIYGVNASAF